MKLLVRVKKTEIVGEYGRDKLEVTCGPRWAGSELVVFRVEDSEQARRAYVIGRDVDVEIGPVRR